MEYINGKDLYQMFNYGTHYITKERTHLNDINVFPVADGDTGNNLLQTFKTIVLESQIEVSFTKMLDSISESALMGARGNSGVIFAQFVNGLNKADLNQDEITINQFADMVEQSYHHTFNSLSNPVEGTMITMMREWAKLLKEAALELVSLKDIFSKSLVKIQHVLQMTKKQLDVLTKNDVVDSGAQGFVLFIEGIVSYYNKDEFDMTEYEDVDIIDQHQFEGEIKYRYCTEGLVSYTEFDEAKLRNILESYGDSVIVAQGKKRFRVHLHTNEPEEVFQKLKSFGTVETQKIDNMELEMSLKNSTQKRVIVTDSIADIDPAFIEENNVVVIPVNVLIDGVNYIDKLSMNNEILFGGLSGYSEYPSTSTPSIKFINDLFSKLLLKYEEVLVLTVSSELSATHEVIKNEALKLQNKGKSIVVVDTFNNSATEGLLVQKAVELLNEGVETKEIVKEIEILREKTRILVCLETFKYATMSGRLPKAVGKIGMLFGLRPIMSLKNGKGSAYGISLSQKGITKKIRKLVEQDLKESGIERYNIVHCLNEKMANEYKELFTKIIGKEPEYITQISSATAIHSGVGSVAIGYIKK